MKIVRNIKKKLLETMLSNLFQRTVMAAQLMFSREVHIFNRDIIKTKVRCHFPKPREVKRINVHGWDKRISTPEGRRVLMRRILKGRHALSH